MEQLKRLWESLSLKHKITVGVAAAAVASILHFGIRWNKERDLKPLYTNLSAEDAGAVVELLDGNKSFRNVRFRAPTTRSINGGFDHFILSLTLARSNAAP